MTKSGSSIRVWVPDVWEVVELLVTPGLTVGEMKASALARAIGSAPRTNPADYIVKYRGALLEDESLTLSGLNVPDKAPMIVLPARRRPVV